MDEWHYGLHGNASKITKYAREDVVKDVDFVVNRFRQRKVHYAFGLLDNGVGDTHCEAGTQGTTHLSRGAEFVKMLGERHFLEHVRLGCVGEVGYPKGGKAGRDAETRNPECSSHRLILGRGPLAACPVPGWADPGQPGRVRR